MQFHAEGLAFCRYVASTNEDPMVTRALEEAESELEPRDRAAEHDPAGHDAVDHLTSRHAGGQPVGVGSW